jgi:hypothetical protein
MPSRAKPRVLAIGLLPAFGRRVSADGVSMRRQTGLAHREFSLFSAVSRGPYRNIRHTSTVLRGAASEQRHHVGQPAAATHTLKSRTM